MNKLFLFFICALGAEQTDILFHLHDAGETFALLPVIRQLDRDYLILTTGVSENLLSGIPKERIRKWNEFTQIEPNEVVTGVASELQGEVLDYFHQKGIQTFAFWDNFNSDGESPYFKIAHSVETRADILLLPCKSLESAFPNRQTRVVGHPTLDPQPRKMVALWVGGYGKDYEEAFELFQEGIKQVDNLVVLIQHHPKTGLKNDLKFSEALPLVDLVICHQSSASFQALAAQKPVLHVIPPHQNYESLPLQQGLAKRVSRVEDFREAIRETAEMDISGFFELMGIPKNSTEMCKEAILLKKS